MTNYQHGECVICHKRDYLRPLHDDKGGPLCCLLCLGKWHGEHGRKRRAGRVVIRALMAFSEAGGSNEDIKKLADSAMFRDFDIGVSEITDQLGYMDGIARLDGGDVDLSSELLADALRLVHPDHQPPERQDLARRVTQQLLALQPFVFPAPKPESPPVSEPTSSVYPTSTPKPKSSSPRYPCADCADTIPWLYCDGCRAEYGKREREEFEQRTTKQRAKYRQRRERKLRHRPLRRCEACGNELKRARTDARFCSDSCRQRGHRKAVTDRSNSHGALTSNRDAWERGILALLERHPAVFLNDLLPDDRTRAQYQALALAALKLEDDGKIDSFSYAFRFNKPGYKVLLRRGYVLDEDRDGKHRVHRLTAQEQHAFMVPEPDEVVAA